MDSNAGFESFAEALPGLVHHIDHARRHVSNGDRMIGVFFWQAARYHVGVTDGFDFFKL